MSRTGSPMEKRRGDSRNKGVFKRTGLARRRPPASTGATPLEVLLATMRTTYADQQRLERRLTRGGERPEAETALLQREYDRLRQLSVAFAREAAPYIHAKLQSVAFTPQPIATQTLTVVRLSAAELKQIQELPN